MGVSEKRVCCTKSSIRSELPYANADIIRAHGQFNNMLNSDLPTKKYLDKLHSIYDLDLFCLNTDLIDLIIKFPVEISCQTLHPILLHPNFASSTVFIRQKISLQSTKFAIIPTSLKNALLMMFRKLTGIAQWQTDL